jgi:hypothetical protein
MSMGQRKGTSFHSRIEVKASTMISILISILILGFLYRNKLTPAGQPPWILLQYIYRHTERGGGGGDTDHHIPVL